MVTPSNTWSRRLAEVMHTPGDGEYGETCRLFNSVVDKRPAFVVRCRDTADVVDAIAFARDSRLELAVRGGGHSVSGASLCDGGVVLDMRGLNAVDVDPGRLTVTVGGGATTGEVDAALQVHGLATTLGRVVDHRRSGLHHGRRIGLGRRKFGFSTDNLLAATLVTAGGEVITTDEETEPDLFWALRGGGGNFGVVTSMTFRAYPQGLATSGLVLYPPPKAPRSCGVYETSCSGRRTTRRPRSSTCMAPTIPRFPRACAAS